MNAETPRRVLIVEDDPRISDVLEYACKADGFSVQIVRRGRDAVARCREDPPCIVILDIGLPDIDGFEVCRQVRMFSTVPLIFLTSRDDEINRVVGLELGGDDYVSKPFSTRELMARIKAVLRRHEPASKAEPVTSVAYGPVAIDADRFRVTCSGAEVPLTRQEFRLLEILAASPGRVFTRDQMLDKAWGNGGLVTDRTIDVHIKSLRKKFAAVAPDFDFIETVRGVGYRAREL